MDAYGGMGTRGSESVPLQGHSKFNPSTPNQPSEVIRRRHLSTRKKKSTSDTEQKEILHVAFPGGSDGKESACNPGDPGPIPGWERPPGEGNGNPLQYSCLENPMDRGAGRATVHGVAKESDMTEQLTLFIFFHDCESK